ncbi:MULTISPECIES: hypothetical protein [unclassified Rathayibacter]|uniref:hypothetical protein n=1 Tax=unclassified Rathayibacter TaxID=2609250 RepID=UPI0006FC153A|nr:MULTISPECIES: hypothetical protein [unclassified Rathayibacter]KQQ03601.1 hypothetical protein ASF42_08885 [Rathayibacter sp. Leaf294]KQS12057.1 hypothetical protein ASG06_08885 [Rathayibacter sp. Leaf185]
MSESGSSQTLNAGRPARFIRWVRTRDRWFPEILHGRYLGTTAQGWEVSADGETRYLDQSVWAVYK